MTRSQKLKRFRRARKRYRSRPTRDNLRTFMHYKATLGWYDKRMFAYNSRSSRVNHGAKLTAMRMNAAWMVVTSTTDGAHAPGSYHSSGRAVDGGLPAALVGTRKGRARLVAFQRQEFSAWAAGKRPGLVELIGPDNNLIVLRGAHAPLAEGTALENQHDNHVHVAYA